ncbi:MAG: SDR family NAD(P)-dependent oxidoreductase [Selenomonadaceae bacterium]|nr:SDR family NAD(P)-dependent oxidoreductase [Selenomonadaceae bacterium]
MKKLAVVIGAGRGMGNRIAARFAKENFRVVLVARRQKLLDEYAAELSDKGCEVFARAADVSDTESLTKIFDDVQKNFGAVDVLIYNAAFMSGGRAAEISAAEAVAHFKVDVAGAIHCVQKILPKQIERGEGAIIFTGGMFGVHPNANFEYACMSMDKSALRAPAQMLNAELKDKGIFAGVVQIMGVVGSNKHFAPENIAEAYWKLYAEKNSFEYIFD